MRLCLIVEERPGGEGLPLQVAEQLTGWGHDVDLLVPGATAAGAGGPGGYDAWVLTTVSDDPGLGLLEQAAATGAVTVNRAWAVRRVRDRALAAALARLHGLPVPATRFVTQRRLLEQIPAVDYPLEVRPANRVDGGEVLLLRSPADLDALDLDVAGLLLAQPHLSGEGGQVRLCVAGRAVRAVRRPSPTGAGDAGDALPLPVPPELRALALEVGDLYGLDIYGVDVVRTAQGWSVVDVHDVLDFDGVPDAPVLVARAILHIAQGAAARGAAGRAAGARPAVRAVTA